jgi:predicted enzyme related to lactoylglutathione lyase
LHGALREAGSVGDGLMTRTDGLLAPPGRLAPEMQVDEIRRRRTIVSNQITHQNIQNIVIDNYSNDHYSTRNRIANYAVFLYPTRMIKSVKFVSIPVRDQNKALDFYTKKLGFQIMTDQPFGNGQRWIELRIPGGDTGVVLFTPQGQENRIGTFSGVSFLSDNVQRTYDDLSARGVEFAQPPKKESWGTSAIFKDSDGNAFVLSSR